MDEIVEDLKTEQIYELGQEVIRLKGQITYLQEELYKVEDLMDQKSEQFDRTIASLERQLGDALYGGDWLDFLCWLLYTLILTPIDKWKSTNTRVKRLKN